MTGFEYGLGIVAVVIGLALTDVAQSTHRLLVRRRAVRWDPLPVLVVRPTSGRTCCGRWRRC